MKRRNLLHKRFLWAKPNLVTESTKHFEWKLFSIWVFSLFLTGCSGLIGEKVEPLVSTSDEFTFEQHEVAIGTRKHQTVLTGFLLGGDRAELAVASIDENNNRQLHIYGFDNNAWRLRLDTILPTEVLFVDVANIAGRDRLITYQHSRLNWLDLKAETAHMLVSVPSLTLPPDDKIPHVNISRDVNGDARDDFVVPDSDGFWVFIQMADGVFAKPVKLGPPPTVDSTYETDVSRYNPWNQSRIHETDYNRDGRNDLVFWNEDHFVVHHQNEHGLFSADTTTFTTDVVFESDELAALAAPHGVRRRRRDHQPAGALTGRVLHAIKDMNADGVTDLGVFSLEGGNLWHMHSTYEVYFGAPTSDGDTTFSLDANTALYSDGIPFGMEQHDFNGDVKIDMMFATIKPHILKAIGMIIGSLLTGSVSLDIEFYRMENNTYPHNSNTTHRFKSYPSGATGGRTAFSAVLIADVNGDKRLDLLIQHEPKKIHVFMGIPDSKLFTQKPQKVAVATPFDERNIWLADLNKDEKQDLLMFHPSATKSHRVTLLIAR